MVHFWSSKPKRKHIFRKKVTRFSTRFQQPKVKTLGENLHFTQFLGRLKFRRVVFEFFSWTKSFVGFLFQKVGQRSYGFPGFSEHFRGVVDILCLKALDLLGVCWQILATSGVNLTDSWTGFGLFVHQPAANQAPQPIASNKNQPTTASGLSGVLTHPKTRFHPKTHQKPFASTGCHPPKNRKQESSPGMCRPLPP